LSAKRTARSPRPSHQRTRKTRIVLVSGFEPFGKERVNPSWEVARRLDGKVIAGLTVKAIRLPVAFSRATAHIIRAIKQFQPVAVIGLGQAGGRPSLSLEQIAINLMRDESHDKSKDRDGKIHRDRAVVRGGPDAYFSRLPLSKILEALRRAKIPASRSLTAGAYACNAVMYATLHQLRTRRDLPVGFIHLPYDAAQAARHQDKPSMSLELMERGVRIAISPIGSATR
jgi:pyroglutamyl-peptidase